MNKLEVYAHRGGAGLFPESTLVAYENAWQLNVDVIDIDIAITKDNIIVAGHDPFLNASFTRDANSQWLTDNNLLIKDFTFDQLQQFDVGRLKPDTKYSQLYPEQQAVDGMRIPSLQQVIDQARELVGDKLRLQLEIKTNPFKPELTVTPEYFMQVLSELLIQNRISAQTEVHSFDWRNMLALQQINSAVLTSYITSETEINSEDQALWHDGLEVNDYDHSYPQMVAAVGGKIWCPDFHDITAEKIAQAHTLGLKVTSWTVDELTDMQRLIEYGIDGIITNRPDRLLALKAKF